MKGALLVAGTASDAGKSTVVAGLCRWLYRRGVRVAPFKAQNMSNNSAVTPDGGEIGRAQALQATACGLVPSVRFNPVLLKPGSDGVSHVVLMGRPAGTLRAQDYRERRAELGHAAVRALAELRAEYDVVVCEGAGSPAEINLRDGDIANMGLARAGRLPTVVVGDIDRGGVFAGLFGTVALLSENDQRLVAGFVINKFRGDPRLLAPGPAMLRRLTGRPVYGVLPYLPELALDLEDSVGYQDGRVLGRPGPPRGTEWLRVAAVRLPRLSNGTDLEALAAEPGVRVRLTTSPAELAEADLVVLPGSRATVDDLDWLRRHGLAEAVLAHARSGRPLLGLCGGYQMLGSTIDDSVESGRGRVRGLGLLPVTVAFEEEKTLRVPSGRALGEPVCGYEIHHGRATVRYGGGAKPLFQLAGGGREGIRLGGIFGTHWHGAFESDRFRRAFLTEVARVAGRRGFQVAGDTNLRAGRERGLDRLADLIDRHLDTKALLRLIEHGPPPDLPFVPPGAPHLLPPPPDPPPPTEPSAEEPPPAEPSGEEPPLTELSSEEPPAAEPSGDGPPGGGPPADGPLGDGPSGEGPPPTGPSGDGPATAEPGDGETSGDGFGGG